MIAPAATVVSEVTIALETAIEPPKASAPGTDPPPPPPPAPLVSPGGGSGLGADAGRRARIRRHVHRSAGLNQNAVGNVNDRLRLRLCVTQTEERRAIGLPAAFGCRGRVDADDIVARRELFAPRVTLASAPSAKP